MVKTLCFQFRVHSFNPWLENKVPHVVQCGQIYVCMCVCALLKSKVSQLRWTVQKHGREELPLTQGQGLQQRVPGCVGTGAAERSYPTSEVRAAAGRSYPMSREWRLHRQRGAERSYSTFKVRRGGHEKIPLLQGKEQLLRFAGAAVKRYPTSKVRETQVRR